MDSCEIISLLRKHPNMFGVDGSFGQTVAFLEGMNAAHEGKLLVGFQEWLVVRVGAGPNLGWPALVLYSAFPQKQALGRLDALSPTENKPAMEALFFLVEEFLNLRDHGDGLLRIYDTYLKWMRGQDWYKPDSPKYLDHLDGP